MSKKYAVEMLNITKMFGDFKAIDNLSLQVEEGTIHALLGENGAGKSTLMNLLFGFYESDSGNIKINGKEAKIEDPNVAHKLGIGMVHQHFKLVKPFTVGENVTLGSEIQRGLLVDKNQTHKNVQEIINKFNFDLDATKKVYDLTVGQQQRVEILKMLYQNANILIFDEPSGALTPQETEELLNTIKELKASGKTIILITHKLNEIKAVADNCTIIRKGKSIDTVKVKDTSSEKLAELMVGRKVSFDVNKKDIKPSDLLLKVQDLEYTNDKHKQILEPTSFEIHKGEIFGIAGIDGNGQLDIVEAITGLKHGTSGSITYFNENGEHELLKMNARKISELSIAHIPQDRHKHGVVLDFNVAEDASLKDYYKKDFALANGLILNKEEMNALGERLIVEHDIRTPHGLTSTLRDMSGGNQQKLIIARELAQHPQLLVASQPTRGVDVGAIENIQTKLLRVREENRAVLLYSLELDEIIDLSDRVLVMYEGRAMGIVDPKKVSKNEIGLMMAGKELK